MEYYYKIVMKMVFVVYWPVLKEYLIIRIYLFWKKFEIEFFFDFFERELSKNEKDKKTFVIVNILVLDYSVIFSEVWSNKIIVLTRIKSSFHF